MAFWVFSLWSDEVMFQTRINVSESVNFLQTDYPKGVFKKQWQGEIRITGKV
jgi:hypothetical protein